MTELGILAPTTILNAVTGPGAGLAFAVPQYRPGRGGEAVFVWEVRLTGSPTSVQVDLEGSIDGSNWYQLGSHTATTDALNWTLDKPVLFVRGNVVTLSGGTSPTATVVVSTQ